MHALRLRPECQFGITKKTKKSIEQWGMHFLCMMKHHRMAEHSFSVPGFFMFWRENENRCI